MSRVKIITGRDHKHVECEINKMLIEGYKIERIHYQMCPYGQAGTREYSVLIEYGECH